MDSRATQERTVTVIGSACRLRLQLVAVGQRPFARQETFVAAAGLFSRAIRPEQSNQAKHAR